ncbi:MAG TPA: hypothetical protein VFY36_00775 [Solirubrobacteraceae bacterium]|nr:hypothetical protein [Solirubrobacteraceae bacterium]
MYWTTARLLRLATPLLAVIAIAGYLVGHQHATVAPAGALGEQTRIAYGTNVLLEYPAGWRQLAASAAPAIPGLRVTHAMLLAPAGDGAHSGLLSGQISGESPLPATLLAQLSGAPQTEVVDLLNAQAYRYSRLSPRGYDRALELYVTPTLGGSQTVLACYASQPQSRSMRQCQQIVARVTLAGSSPTDLTPDGHYAARLKQLIGTLDAKRLELRKKLSRRSTATALAHLATTLADSFTATARSLTTLESPRAANPTQMALTSSILAARRAYEALATAARRSASYATAQARVAEAESNVDAALQTFTLLGYTRPS